MKIKLRRKTKILALLLMLTMLFTSSFNSFAEINPTDLDIDTDIDEAVDSLNSEVATEEHEQKIVDQALIEDSDLKDSDKNSSSEKNVADLLSEPLTSEPKSDETPENAGESKLEDSEEVDPLEEDQAEEDKKIDQAMGLDMFLAGSLISNIPSYQSYKVFSSQMKSMSTMNMLSGASNSPTNPGQVTVDKFAETVPGLVNTWDVTLRIEAMDKEVSSDIVLVIDRSGSMEGSRLTKAKDAARKFIDELKEESNTRIAIVSYASSFGTATTVTTHTGLLNVSNSSNRTNLKTAINSINALGGTNTQAGIRVAHQILAGSSADFKNIVLLSDGEPTQSYSLSSITSNKFEYFGQTSDYEYQGNTYQGGVITYRSKSTLTTSDYNYNQTVGYGSQTYTRIGWDNSDRKFYSHGNSAIAQAAIYKNSGILWTIALETTNYGNEVLNNIATPGKAYTATETQLEAIFSEIAGSISSAAKDVVVSDPMGPGFEIPAANVSGIVVSQGTVSYQNEKIDWNVGNLTTPISAGSNINYAQLKYRIEINDEILGQTADANGEYPTNGLTTASYIDINNIGQIAEFPIPKVDPVLWIVEKVLLDKNGNEFLPDSSINPTFKVNLKSGTLYDQDWNLNIGPAANRTLITDLRAESLYTVSELNQVSAFGDIINLDPFDTKIEIKEGLTGSFVEKNTFEIDTDSNGHPNEDIYIKITNQFKEIDVEANKVWEGGPADKPAIDLQLYRKTNAANSQELLTGYLVTLYGNEATAWRHKWENLPTYNSQGLAYQYFVRETNLPDNYTADAVDDLTITNTYKYKTVIISKRVTGNMGDLNKAFSFTATLSDGATFPDIDVEGYTISTDGKTASFALKDEEFLTLTVPSNSQINLTESDNAGYTVSYSVNNGSAQTGGQITNLELEDASTTIEFTNHKDEYIDSGINLDSLPYLIIIGVAILGGIIWIIKKRKKTDLS